METAIEAKTMAVFNTKDLKKSLRFFSKVVSRMPVVPALEMIMFEGKGDHVTLTASNLQAFVFVDIDTLSKERASKDFSFLLEYHMLNGILKHVPDEMVRFEYDGNEVSIEWTDCNISITPDTKVEDYPAYTGNRETFKSFKIPTAKLLEGFALCNKTVSNDDLRPAMTCINCDTIEGVLKFVSTTGHSLTLYNTGENVEIRSFLVSRIVADIFATGVLKAEEETQVFVSNEWVVFKNGDSTIAGRLLNERYPDWRAALDMSEPTLKVEVDSSLLLKKLAIANLMSCPYTKKTELHFSKDSVRIVANDLDYGYNTEQKLEVKTTSKESEMKVGFNGRFLTSALQSCKGVFKLGIHRPNKGALITYPVKFCGELIVMIMPVLLGFDSGAAVRRRK